MTHVVIVATEVTPTASRATHDQRVESAITTAVASPPCACATPAPPADPVLLTGRRRDRTGARANVRRMSDASSPGTDRAGWEERRRRWKVERLDPALARAPERQPSFRTLGEIELDPIYGPWLEQDARSHRAARRSAVHPWDPPLRLPLAALDDANVRRLRGRGGHQRPVQGPPRGRPDRPLDRLRHADPLRLRHRRRRGGGRVRDVWRRGRARWPTWRSSSTACRSTASRPR